MSALFPDADKFLGWHGTTEKESLHAMAVVLLEKFHLLLRLDTLGDDVQVQTPGFGNDGLRDCHIVGIALRNAANKGMRSIFKQSMGKRLR